MKNTIIIGYDTQLIKNLKRRFLGSLINYNKHYFSNKNFIIEFIDSIDVQDIFIIVDFSYDLHRYLWELLFICDYLSSLNKNIKNLIFAYFPYSRSNNSKCNQTQNLSTIIRSLNLYSIERISTIEPHFGEMNIGFKGEMSIIRLKDIFFNEIAKHIDSDKRDNTILIGPDKGSLRMVKEISDSFNIDFHIFDKYRIDHSEKVFFNIGNNSIHYNSILKKKRQIFIFDDEICSGNTIIGIVNYLYRIRDNFDIYIFIAHSFLQEDFFLKEYSKELKIFCTNSIDYCYEMKNHLKIKDLSKILFNIKSK